MTLWGRTRGLLIAFLIAGLLTLPAVHSAVHAAVHAAVPKDTSVVIDTDKFTLTLLSGGVPIKRFPVAVGKPETPTPVGQWEIINKYKDWGGGFGTRWIGLNVPWGTYGIHGTNKPFSIGRNMSSGCIRMHNGDVEQLYDCVRVGTPVIIVGHPFRHFRRIAAGDVGADVWLVQSSLYRLGFYHGKIDGRFDKLTEEAVKNFEKATGLPVDGVVSLHDYQQLGLQE